jgi:glutamine synthetase
MDKKEILELLEKEKDIKYIRIIFPDILGRMLDFTIPSEELDSAFEEGKGIDGSSIEGFARIEESDLVVVPDASTFRVLPWEYQSDSKKWREAIVIASILNTKREPFAGDTRNFLKQTLEKTKKYGEMFVGPELEFFIFNKLESENSNCSEKMLTDKGGYFHGGEQGELRKETQLYLGELGIKCDFDHHEVAPSQHEIDIKYSKALEIADSIMLAKYITKRVARKHNLFASFMPKPLQNQNGSGMHLHISLWENGKNLFFNQENIQENGFIKEPLSDMAKKYIMGLIKYGKEIQLALNQWVNSYKRLTPGFEAPVYLAWGQKNRSAYIRVPKYSEGKENATRIELRNPDPACNPYLALAMIHLAGIQGIEDNLPFTMPVEENIFEMDEKQREKENIVSLSQNLYESLGFFQNSSFVKNNLNSHLFDKLIENKRLEWQEFSRKVTDYEIKNYFFEL